MKKYFIYFSIVLTVLVVSGQGCMSLDGETKIETSGPGGMFVSTDKGETWKIISSMPTVEGVKQLDTISVYRIVEDPADTKAMYWASRERGLFYSFDDGKSWQRPSAPVDSAFIYDVAIDPENRCSIYATNGRAVYRTDDCMRSWVEVYQEVRSADIITSVSFNPFKAHHIYITESNGDLLKSEDLGQHWSVVNRFGVDIRDVEFDAHKEGLVYIVTRSSGLFRSRDGGVTWDSTRATFNEYPGALTFRRFLIYPSKSDQIYWVSQYGVLVSRNAGDDWEPINLVTPPGSVDIYGFTVNPLNDQEIYYTGSIDYRSTFYRSVDGGKTWETRKLPSKQLPTVLRAHPENDGWLYMGFTIPPQD
ncbi:MAG TPA: hypothetical protein DCS29_03345 [Candidatus Magasanikbacteria bacterium]|nr:MAG: hypothetical protein A2479_01415 [Candidatus Magasanikbacteria bacterium RIFOXYC2_FULL_39_8]HAT03781.1 hypothetical protein [Candidatus Magasanikbacteria bacterium]